MIIYGVIMANTLEQIEEYTYSTQDTTVASIGTSYNVAKYHTHLVGRYSKRQGSNILRGENFEAIWMDFASISSATAVTIRVCTDADGDQVILGDTAVTIDPGITTTSKGSAQIKVDIPFFNVTAGTTVFLFIKTNAGTLSLTKSQFVWR
jgi:hypothetical protein